MRESVNYGLKLVEGTDIVNPLVIDAPNYEIIDEEMKKNKDSSITVATELLSGSVHALTRVNEDSAMFRFVATSSYKSGETFTVDGVQVTALLPTGETLPTGAYIIGTNVLCCLTGTLLTIYCTLGGEFTSYNSERLGGKLPNYYATNAQFVEAKNIAQSANEVSVANSNNIAEIQGKLGELDARQCKIGLWGKEWNITSTYKNIGSNAEKCPPIDNQYFKSTSGTDAYIEVKQSGLYTVESRSAGAGSTSTSGGHLYSRITLDNNKETVPDQLCVIYVYGNGGQCNGCLSRTMYLEAGTQIRLEVSSEVSTLKSSALETLIVTKIL